MKAPIELPDWIKFNSKDPNLLTWTILQNDTSMSGQEFEIRTRMTVWDADVSVNGLNSTNEGSWLLKLFDFKLKTVNEPP